MEPPTKEQIEACVPEVRMDKDFILFGCYMKPVASHKYLYTFNYILVIVRNGRADRTSKNETQANV